MGFLTGCEPKDNEENAQENVLEVVMEGNIPVYHGDDLGAKWTPEKTDFEVWSPEAEAVTLRLYEAGNGGEPLATHEMAQDEHGVWRYSLKGDQEGTYYTFQVRHNASLLDETGDTYGIATGVNGQRSMVVNLNALEPAGWQADKGIRMANWADIILYEMHVRDFSISPNSGIQNKGKFIGLVESGTTGPKGVKTGIDHLKQLGITHVHLLPSFDHQSIDEEKLDTPQYNWGYDPLNYNIPEGSYATDPYDGHVRIREFREMVKGLHDAGIGVVLDVVYNHTGATEGSIFNKCAPGYYYRKNEDGSYSNASGCGNETASEKAMMRKYIVESVVHWVKNYHIDGFRFDLMGIHDIETMNAVRAAVDKIDPQIFLYGEGWTAGDSPLAEELRAVKKHTNKLNGIAAFCDDMRDAIKGHWADKKDNGFASGKKGTLESIKFGLLGAISTDLIDYEQVNYSDAGWANEPTQCINYVECHDDLCLRDKLVESTHGLSEKAIMDMHKLANSLVLVGQGVPFLHSGAEMFRTKQGDHNSYKSPDAINQIDWGWKSQYAAHFAYYRDLIAMRKAHPAFRLGTKARIEAHIGKAKVPFEAIGGDTQAFRMGISGVENDDWEHIQIIANAAAKPVKIKLDEPWKIGFSQSGSHKDPKTVQGSVSIPPRSFMVLFQPSSH